MNRAVLDWTNNQGMTREDWQYRRWQLWTADWGFVFPLFFVPASTQIGLRQAPGFLATVRDSPSGAGDGVAYGRANVVGRLADEKRIYRLTHPVGLTTGFCPRTAGN